MQKMFKCLLGRAILHMRQLWVFSSSSRIKCAPVWPQNIPRPYTVSSHSAQKTASKISPFFQICRVKLLQNVYFVWTPLYNRSHNLFCGRPRDWQMIWHISSTCWRILGIGRSFEYGKSDFFHCFIFNPFSSSSFQHTQFPSLFNFSNQSQFQF